MSVSYLFTKQNPYGQISVDGYPRSNLEVNVDNHFDLHEKLERGASIGWGFSRHYRGLYPRGNVYFKLLDMQIKKLQQKDKILKMLSLEEKEND